MKTSEIKPLFLELLNLLCIHGDETLNPQKAIIRHILLLIDSGCDEFSEIQRQYKTLFSPKSGLSEFYIWKDSLAERIAANKPFEEIRQALWDILE